MYSHSSDPYNHAHTTMVWYHSLFRTKWANINKELASNSGPQRLIPAIADFCMHLDFHHRIEEAHWFPLLATRLPQFSRSGVHVAEHAVMHAALGNLQGYAADVQAKREPFEKVKVQALVKILEDALFPHLQEEEESLKGENLRKAGFSLAELSRLE
jgi:hemerythrin-like domain-containing protein